MARQALATLTLLSLAPLAGANEPLKQQGAFYPSHLIAKARENIRQYDWARAIQKPIVAAAEPWMKLSDDELWELMFGNTIKRSWMVWSNGHCPACKEAVPMYNWKMDALHHPWKTRCPHCQELFPKNDFEAYYRSGLDAHRVFQPALADRSLLFNAEHPDPDDPLHMFGVDDGEGYVEGDNRWRFIGAYLIFGQWKQAIVGGIRELAAAYAVTGDHTYAHKAGVLLDRVADLYPTFDFGKEGVMYEGPPARGYVSTWHDACSEIHDLAFAYDQVFEALRDDNELIRFLSAKARQYKLENPKRTFEHVQRNIEQRIFRDTLANRPKIESNYPMTDTALIVIRTVLEWPANRDQVIASIDELVAKAVAVDGMSGEKGLTGYSLIAPHSVAKLLGFYMRVDPNFLAGMVKRHPRLHDMYRFHIDTWCIDSYYPRIGDTSAFGAFHKAYVGLSFATYPGVNPSSYTFMDDLYQQTGDVDFVKVLYQMNGGRTAGLPRDLFAEDVAAMQTRVQAVIDRETTKITVGGINKQEWHLAILRSGKGEHRRALWLDYDSGGAHGHADGMNIGLFAKGLDLMPDFGYPPVQYGGWYSPRARWYTMTAAHNTVMVDGRETQPAAGETTLWADGRHFRAIRVAAPDLIEGPRFERTLVMIDIDEKDSYVLDVFRVRGGNDHLKFMRSTFGDLDTSDFSLTPIDPPAMLPDNAQMRNFRKLNNAGKFDWTIEDRLNVFAEKRDVHLRYTELTTLPSIYLAESWIDAGGFSTNKEEWIPTVVVHHARDDDQELASCFVSVIEPYENQSGITDVKRHGWASSGLDGIDMEVVVEIKLQNGSRDILFAGDVEGAFATFTKDAPAYVLNNSERRIKTDASLCWIRYDADGGITDAAMCQGTTLTTNGLRVSAEKRRAFAECSRVDHVLQIVTGEHATVHTTNPAEQ